MKDDDLVKSPDAQVARHPASLRCTIRYASFLREGLARLASRNFLRSRPEFKASAPLYEAVNNDAPANVRNALPLPGQGQEGVFAE